MLMLDPQYLKIVQDILAKDAPDQTVWAFGSRVKGTAHPGSDLDLVIFDASENDTPEQSGKLLSAFRDSNLPVSVDIMLWSEVPEAFRANMREHHEVLQESSAGRNQPD